MYVLENGNGFVKEIVDILYKHKYIEEDKIIYEG